MSLAELVPVIVLGLVSLQRLGELVLIGKNFDATFGGLDVVAVNG